MFAIGHIALGYLLGRSSAKLLNVEVVVPYLIVLSILPDADIVFRFLLHRGPTHSVITGVALFVPLFIVYRRRAVPYLVALLSHAVVGDFLVGGKIQLLWPVSSKLYSFPGLFINIMSPLNVALETALFLVATAVMFKTGDIRNFFKKHLYNLALIVPIFTTLLPTVLAYPLSVPVLLIPEHVFNLVLFSLSAGISIPWALKRMLFSLK